MHSVGLASLLCFTSFPKRIASARLQENHWDSTRMYKIWDIIEGYFIIRL
jgi:hypothetical protein